MCSISNAIHQLFRCMPQSRLSINTISKYLENTLFKNDSIHSIFTPWVVTSVITSFGVYIEWTGRDFTRWVVNFHSTEWNLFTPYTEWIIHSIFFFLESNIVYFLFKIIPLARGSGDVGVYIYEYDEWFCFGKLSKQDYERYIVNKFTNIIMIRVSPRVIVDLRGIPR